MKFYHKIQTTSANISPGENLINYIKRGIPPILNFHRNKHSHNIDYLMKSELFLASSIKAYVEHAVI